MNDISEKDFHEEEADNIFLFCLCNSKSEKIPMWYLYSGICGKGARLTFTPSVLLALWRSIKEVYVVENGEVNKNRRLKNVEDFDLKCGWVYYQKSDRIFKFKGKWYEIENPIEPFYENNYFIKDYPWEYEKEFRFVFRIHSNQNIEKIAISLDDLDFRKLKIQLAPECTEEIKESTLEMDGFKRFYKDQIKDSELRINMDLLNRNKDDIFKNLDIIFKDQEIGKLCEKISKNKMCSKNKQ